MMWFQVKHVSLRISLCYHRTMQPHFRLHHPHPKPEAAHATHKSENQVLAENGGCLANFSGENDGYSNSYRLIDHGNLMVTDVKG